MVDADPQRLTDRWPVLAGQLRAALIADDERELVGQVDELRVVELCDCGDDFCQSFYTQPPPEGSYPYDENRARNVVLRKPGWAGELILDVVDGQIAYVEVLGRAPID